MCLILTITALPVGNLTRVMTPVSRFNPPVKSVLLSPKQKKDTTSSKDDELDLIGDEDVESFTGSHADLESAATILFTSPPHPQPLPYHYL